MDDRDKSQKITLVWEKIIILLLLERCSTTNRRVQQAQHSVSRSTVFKATAMTYAARSHSLLPIMMAILSGLKYVD